MANQKILRYGTAGAWMVVMDGDRGMPEGGFNRQILTKTSGANFETQWRDPSGFTFTQSGAPTVALDGTSPLTTGETWYDTANGDSKIWVTNQWVKFSGGDDEARFMNTTGDTMNGQLIINGGGGDTMELKPGTANHVYIEFFARTANPASRSGYLGFPAAGSNDFTIANSLPGDIVLAPSTGRVVLNADPTSALHAATKQYVDAADATKLSLAGGAMTGIIDFSNTLGKKIELYDGYSFEMESGTLRYRSGGVHAFTGAITTNGNVTTTASVVTTRPGGLWLNGASDSNHRIVSVNNLAGMPWSDGPVLCGANGWAFLSAATGTYLMGFRGTTDNSRRYLWVSDGMLVGTAPDDASNTHTLRVVGNAHINTTLSTGQGISCAGNGGFGGRTTVGTWDQNGNYSAIMGHYGYHLMGGVGDGSVHTRGNNAGWHHYIGAGSLIVHEQWTNMALGGGSGGTLVQKSDGVIANAASRRILKEQIEPLQDTIDAGAVIDALEPVTFIWRKRDDPMSQFYALQRAHMETPHEGEYGPVYIPEEVAAAVPHYDDDAAEAWRKADLRFGLIADDVAVVRPEMANWEFEMGPDGKRTQELIPGSWNEQALITVLVQGVQDLRARVAVLEALEAE